MSDQPGDIDEAASEALERWADTIPPEVRLRAEVLWAGGAVTHLTPLAHGEWAAVVKDSRRHEVSATWDGANWTIAWAGRSQPRSAAAEAAVGLALIDQDRRRRRNRLLPSAARSFEKANPIALTPSIRVVIPFHLRIDATSDGLDWFELRAVREIGETTLTALELKALVEANGSWVNLGRKGWHRLEDHTDTLTRRQLEIAGLHARSVASDARRLHALQLSRDGLRQVLDVATLERVDARAREIQDRPAPEPPVAIEAQLRPYQRDGFQFLCALSHAGCGGILADDMGLGKTVQALAWLAHLRDHTSPASPRAALVICPKSLMENWRAEARRFLPGLRVRAWKPRELRRFHAEAHWADLNIVSHPQLRQLAPTLERLSFLAAIVDEAQAIKNPASAIARAVRALDAEHRLALTGTPIENRLLDLWSIMSFAMPGALGSRAQFERELGSHESPTAGARWLAARIRPFVLRRTKSQVATDLPPKIEKDIVCEMSGLQQTLYRAELKKAQQQLLVVENERQFQHERFHILASLMRLRQICCDPALAFPGTRASIAKFEAMDDLLDPILAEGHKVLIFSQFTTLLRTARKRVAAQGAPVFVLTGKTESRGAVVSRFNATVGPAVFLISLKAGGSGLNLASASYVILLDPWWNPAAEAQAIDRAHRIGQTRTVIAYRLLIKESIEEKIQALQATKSTLAGAVLGDQSFAKAFNLAEWRALLAP